MGMFASRCMKAAVSMMMIPPKLAGIDLFPIRLTMSSNGDLGRVLDRKVSGLWLILVLGAILGTN